MKAIFYKPDLYGVLASALCMLHCLLTPFVFILQSCTSTCCESSPFWWRTLDFIFLAISAVAIYFSLKSSANVYVKNFLIITWFLLLIFILNENLNVIKLPKTLTYITAILLSIFHIYNLKYCQCEKTCMEKIT